MKVAYGKENPPNQAEEKETLLKPEEQPQDTNENGDTVKEKGDDENQNGDTVKEEGENENGDTVKEKVEDVAEPKHNDNEDDGEDMDGEVVEYTDENGRRVRRVVKKTVTTTTTRTTSGSDDSPKNLTREILEMTHDKPEDNKDENTEVMEYVDKNGRRVRRIVKKTTITTVKTKRGTNGNGSSGVTTETREIISGRHDPETFMINFGGGGQLRPSEEQTTLQSESKPRALREKEVLLHFDTKPQAKEENLIDVEIKKHAFPKHDFKGGHTTITTESSGGDKNGGNYTSVYKRTVVTKTIGGDENRNVVEHSTTASGRDGEHPIVVFKKERSSDLPEWLEERTSPGTQRRSPKNSDISIHLKYPSDYAPQKKEPEEKANESKIHPEVARREKPDISILSLEDVVKEKEKEKGEVKKTEQKEVQSAPPQPAPADDDDDDEEEEDDDDDEDAEYDEFEEEIVVMEVSRKARFPKALEKPKPEPEKVGVPIEDLLEVPTLEVKQESAPDNELLVEEKIESVERPPVVFSELPDLGILDNL